jgi:hypothetical protein
MYQHLELQTTYFLVGHKLYANLMGKIEPVKKHLEQLGIFFYKYFQIVSVSNFFFLFHFVIFYLFLFLQIDAVSPYRNIVEGCLLKKGKNLGGWKKYPP